jgi:hypothetical protein
MAGLLLAGYTVAFIALDYGDASASFLTATFVREQLGAYGRTLLVLPPYITSCSG